MNNDDLKKILTDICSDYCSEDNDCVLKQFILSVHPSPRLLVQAKCVQRFKKLLAKESNRDPLNIEWGEAMMEWVERGYAEKFAKVYREKARYDTIYKEIMSEK